MDTEVERVVGVGGAPGDLALGVGIRVEGRWVLDECLAHDVGGALWVARDERLQRDVVLRFVPAQRLADDAERREVVHEASLLARIEHQNVVCLFDVVDHASGLCFVTEYVEGHSLELVAEHLSPCEEPLVAAVGLQLARGLRAVHERGVIHHDLQRRHVRVLANGTVKILDFGSATGFTSAGRTTAGIPVPAYLAPEQVEGGASDHRVDIYALGLLLWELAAGAPAFPAKTPSAALEARLSSDPRPLASLGTGISEQLSAVVATATHRRLEQRCPHAADLEAALTRVCGPRPEQVVRSHLEAAGLG